MNDAANHDGHLDLIVVGLGGFGSAALFHAARAGLRVLGIDRFDPPHTFGSTHAESRITRLAVGEGPQYLPFVARSHEIWREIEALTGEVLLHQPGGYIITPPAETDDNRWGGFVHRTAAVAEQAGIDFELRTPDQVMAHKPNLIVKPDAAVGFEPTGGVVMCERAVGTQLRLAQAAGAQIITHTVVDNVRPDGNGVQVSANGSVLHASSVIVTTGAWFDELAPTVDGDAVEVTRQVVYWFDVDEPDVFSAEHFPFVLWPGHDISEYSAVFPRGDGARPGLKLLGEQFHITTTADTVDRTVSTAETDDFYERLVEPRVRGVNRELLDATVCLYTNTVDDHFLIDTHLESDNIIFASACSGHGFKHSTAIGEALVAQACSMPGGLSLAPFARS